MTTAATAAAARVTLEVVVQHDVEVVVVRLLYISVARLSHVQNNQRAVLLLRRLVKGRLLLTGRWS